MTKQEMIVWIDNASYEQLFRKMRFAPIGDPFFQGDVGKHFMKVFSIRRKEVGPAEHTATSKRIGWDPQG